MRSKSRTTLLKLAGLATTVVCCPREGAAGAQTVSLKVSAPRAPAAGRPTVPMWGYSCLDAGSSGSDLRTAANSNAGTGWSPMVITAAPGQPHHQSHQRSTRRVPTSLVIVGQLGGGLGATPTTTASPPHGTQGTTWPIAGSGSAVHSAGPGPARAVVRNRGGQRSSDIPDLDQSGARHLPDRIGHASFDSGADGLYGIVVVTNAPTGGGAGTAYPGVSYNAEVPMLLSEIDPVQNDGGQAVQHTWILRDDRLVRQPGGCGNPSSSTYLTCYPPAVNYDPRYYLVNGVAFDKTALAAGVSPSLFQTTPATNYRYGAGAICERRSAHARSGDSRSADRARHRRNPGSR